MIDHGNENQDNFPCLVILFVVYMIHIIEIKDYSLNLEGIYFLILYMSFFWQPNTTLFSSVLMRKSLVLQIANRTFEGGI